jgi:hypothetical protein
VGYDQKYKVHTLFILSIYKDIRAKQDKHLYDMQYKNEVYVSDLWNILKKQGNKIIIAEDKV